MLIYLLTTCQDRVQKGSFFRPWLHDQVKVMHMDAETKQYIDQKFAQLVRAIGRGFAANDGEHGRLADRLISIEEVMRSLDLDRKAQSTRIERLETTLFGEQD